MRTSKAQVVKAAVSQAMQVVSSRVDTDDNEKLDAAELLAVRKEIHATQALDQPLPPEDMRMKLAMMHTLSRMSADNPKLREAGSFKLSALRAGLKVTFTDALAAAKGPRDTTEAVAARKLLPDAALEYLQARRSKRA
jgi:hypothetical protein